MGMERRVMHGDKAWAAMWVGIAIYDMWAYRRDYTTMSAAAKIHLQHPVKRALLLAWWGYVTAHLFGWLPDHWDPIRRWGAPVQYKDLPWYAQKPPP